MRRNRLAPRLLPLAVLLITACGGPAPSQEGAVERPAQAVARGRTLTMLVRFEVTDLAPKIPGGGSPIITKRLFNAFLALVDDTGGVRPYLAESLPQLNTESWQVFPDGRMETTYRLRTGLTWHDGSPLTADDFAFALRVYRDPGLGVFPSDPQDRMAEIVGPDPRTIVIRWSGLSPDAGSLKAGGNESDFDPLPRHLLGSAFAAYEQDPATRDAFLGLPYWTTEYVGAGPFRLDRWEPGSHLEGTAFDGHALGRPKVDRLIVRINPDENTVLSTVLAGNADFSADFTLRFEHAMVLKREWEAQGKGVVILKRSGPVSYSIQLRPELVGHQGQLDVRVRRAMAHALDRQDLNDGLFEGQGFPSETTVPHDLRYFGEVDQAIFKYPYDLRRSDGLMAEAGYARDADGFFASPTLGRFRSEFRVIAGPEFERGHAIMTDGWRRAGIETPGAVLPASLVRDRELQHQYSGMATRGGGLNERTFTSREIGSAANRWVGENRSGWANADYDRLFEAFGSTLDRGERTRQVVQMQRLVTEHLPVFMLYFAIQVNTRVANLVGPEPGTPGAGTFTPGTVPWWNVHEWHFQ
jgi:peptide/nickel transport system substrate-binding protein